MVSSIYTGIRRLYHTGTNVSTVVRMIGRASVLGTRGSTDKSRGLNSAIGALFVICTGKSRETPSRGEDKWE